MGYAAVLLMNLSRLLLASPLLVLAGVAGCSGAPDSNGIDPAKRLLDFTPEDMVKQCDFKAARQGGYGSSSITNCALSGVALEGKAPKDRATCVAESEAMGARYRSPGVVCEATADDLENIPLALATCQETDDFTPAFPPLHHLRAQRDRAHYRRPRRGGAVRRRARRPRTVVA